MIDLIDFCDLETVLSKFFINILLYGRKIIQCVCEELTRDKIDAAIAIADSEMYHDKQKIKQTE